MPESLSRRTVFNKLASEFKLLSDFKATCAREPEASYTETMELKVQALDMVVVTLPGPDQ